MMHSFRFCMPVQIRYQAGLSQQLSSEVHGQNVLLICDPFLFESGVALKIGAQLTEKTVTYYSRISPNPSCNIVDEAATLARECQASCVIGLGGGSSLDVAKIVSCLINSPGSIYDYYAGGTKTLQPRTTQLILIPTTAGTGSEVTNVGVFTDPRKGIKLPFVTDRFWADLTILDPELTVSLPPSVTASTGMDAFCHAIEAYWNRESQPMCDMLALGAMQLILQNIKQAYDHPEGLQARGNMLQASLIAGVAFSQTRTTGIHALSFPLTTQFHASHGTACAITLPAFIRLCGKSAPQKLLVLAQTLGYDSADALADAIEQLMQSMKLPTRLHELGVQADDIAQITQVGLGAAIIQLTPAEMNKETVQALLHSIL